MGEPQRTAGCVSLALARSYIGRLVTVHVDRPIGSCHPRCDLYYPVNYGHLPGVRAPDGSDLDAYVLGIDGPVRAFSGRCIAVIDRWDDDDAKLIVVPDGTALSDDEIAAQVRFCEQFFDSHVLRS